MSVTLLYALALLPFAVFFGIAAYLWMAPVYDKLSAAAFIELFQKLDPYMKVRAKFLLFAELLFTIGLLALRAGTACILELTLLAAALSSAFGSMLIAVKGNVPLNREMDQWDPGAPPAGWEGIRQRWLFFHHCRGGLEAAGFLCLLAAALWHGNRV